MHALTIELVFAVAFAGGLLSLWFDVADQAYLPTVVDRDRLVEGNSKLELSRTAAEIAGPGLAGWLVQALTAPLAILLDALSFLGSAVLLWRVRAVERPPTRSDHVRRIGGEIAEGVRVVVGNAWLRAIAGGAGLLGFFNALLESVFVLYVARALGLSPALVGTVFAVGSVGFVVGSLLPERLARRFGLGRTTVAAVALVAASDLLVPLAGGSVLLVGASLAVAQFFFGIGLTVFNFNQASLRQAIVPGRLQGRASAMIRLLAAGWCRSAHSWAGFSGRQSVFAQP
jgi:hypothetical protein